MFRAAPSHLLQLRHQQIFVAQALRAHGHRSDSVSVPWLFQDFTGPATAASSSALSMQLHRLQATPLLSYLIHVCRGFGPALSVIRDAREVLRILVLAFDVMVFE
ncbi:hypothetical protein NDU88_007131 [Pleurodeles waltl]|uniref:Uncharacterized protein n=1 Tax=Pleurodeles waltl TaxID=8319 RepID=A0AAV7TZ42_PLEWA|nr:hypothetical protein NDU88_007131 [Pleurodeles waltl]